MGTLDFFKWPSAQLRLGQVLVNAVIVHVESAQTSMSGYGLSGLSRHSECGSYVRTAADASTPDCFAGASVIRAAPMMLNTVAAISRSPRSFGRWIAMTAITAP